MVVGMRDFGFAVGAMQTVLVATHNAHKVEEIRSLMGAGITVNGIDCLGVALTPDESGETFEANARLKALAWRDWLRNHSTQHSRFDWVLADDSGLEVDALGGAPGVHSARFAAVAGHTGNAPDGANNAKLLMLLDAMDMPQRTARFRCALALLPIHRQEGLPEDGWLFEGACEGRIGRQTTGSGGFGYDPLFIPQGYEESLACLGAEIKNQLSHRAKALGLLKAFLATGTGASLGAE